MQDTHTGAGSFSIQPVSEAEVSAELRKILASTRFSNLGRLRSFLSYVVKETLNGRGGQLKEVVIAMEAFGRDGSYDPRLDATVRVQAGRLRSALKDYYETDGQNDPIKIEIPKGTYEPVFHGRPKLVLDAVEQGAVAHVPVPTTNGEPAIRRVLCHQAGARSGFRRGAHSGDHRRRWHHP